MKLVIDISEESYERIKYMYLHNNPTASEFKSIIEEGVPLVDYLVKLKAEIIKAMVDYDSTDATTVDCAALDIIDRRTGRKFKTESEVEE